MKTALVLEGGGLRGIYSAGVLDFLLESNIKVDAIFGVSAGALYGINYASKQEGRVIRYNKKYIRDKRFMSFRNLIKTGNFFDTDFCYDKLVNELDVFDYETFKKSGIDFYAVVTNVETGKAEYKLIKDCKKEVDYLRASGSLPLLSQIVEIDGKKYLDGAISDSIPVKKAREMGYEKIIVIQTRIKSYRMKSRKEGALIKLVYNHYPKFGEAAKTRNIRYNEALDFIKEEVKNKRMFSIQPSKYVKIGRLEKNPEKLQEMYDLGWNDAQNIINDLKAYLAKGE